MDFLDLDPSFIQNTQPLSYAYSQELQELMNTMENITEEGVMNIINKNNE